MSARLVTILCAAAVLGCIERSTPSVDPAESTDGSSVDAALLDAALLDAALVDASIDAAPDFAPDSSAPLDAVSPDHAIVDAGRRDVAPPEPDASVPGLATGLNPLTAAAGRASCPSIGMNAAGWTVAWTDNRARPYVVEALRPTGVTLDAVGRVGEAISPALDDQTRRIKLAFDDPALVAASVTEPDGASALAWGRVGEPLERLPTPLADPVFDVALVGGRPVLAVADGEVGVRVSLPDGVVELASGGRVRALRIRAAGDGLLVLAGLGDAVVLWALGADGEPRWEQRWPAAAPDADLRIEGETAWVVSLDPEPALADDPLGASYGRPVVRQVARATGLAGPARRVSPQTVRGASPAIALAEQALVVAYARLRVDGDRNRTELEVATVSREADGPPAAPSRLTRAHGFSFCPVVGDARRVGEAEGVQVVWLDTRDGREDIFGHLLDVAEIGGQLPDDEPAPPPLAPPPACASRPVPGTFTAWAATRDRGDSGVPLTYVQARADGAVVLGEITAAGVAEVGPLVFADEAPARLSHPLRAARYGDRLAIIAREQLGGAEVTSGWLVELDAPGGPLARRWGERALAGEPAALVMNAAGIATARWIAERGVVAVGTLIESPDGAWGWRTPPTELPAASGDLSLTDIPTGLALLRMLDDVDDTRRVVLRRLGHDGSPSEPADVELGAPGAPIHLALEHGGGELLAAWSDHEGRAYAREIRAALLVVDGLVRFAGRALTGDPARSRFPHIVPVVGGFEVLFSEERPVGRRAVHVVRVGADGGPQPPRRLGLAAAEQGGVVFALIEAEGEGEGQLIGAWPAGASAAWGMFGPDCQPAATVPP